MFDFDPGAARAPKVFLDATTGQPLGGPPAHVAIAPARPDPGPRPTEVARPTRRPPTAVATPRPPPTPKPPTPDAQARGQAELQGQRRRQEGHASRARRAARTRAKRTALRFRIVSGKRSLATATGKLAKKKTKVVIRPKKALKKGKYTLRITITQTGGTLALTTRRSA